jgi:hypothetical protein
MFENFQTINLFGTDGLHTKIVHITTKLILGPHDKPTCPKNTQPNQCVGCRVFLPTVIAIYTAVTALTAAVWYKKTR